MVNTTYLAVFVLYMLGVIGIGLYAWNMTDNTPADYYIAGRGLGTVVLSFTLLATVMSAWTFFGLGAISYGTGLGVFVFIGLASVLWALTFSTFGERVNEIGRNSSLLTPVEYLKVRYGGHAASLVYLGAAVIFLTVFVATQIVGGGIAIEILLDIPYEWAVVSITVVMAIYLHLAGMTGVAWTDTLQGIFMAAVLMGTFVAILLFTGSNALVEQTSAANFQLPGPAGVWSSKFIVSFALMMALGVPAYPQVYQRFLSGESKEIMRKSALLFPVVAVPVFFVAAALGVWSTGLVPEGTNPDYVIPLLIEQVMPDIITALIISGGVAALMSTADSVVLSLSSMITRDFYCEYVDQDVDGGREVHVAQVTQLGLLGLALGLAIIRPAGIFKLGVLPVVGFATTAPALFFGLFWSGATRQGTVSSIGIGGILAILYFLGVIPSQFTFGLHYGFITTAVSISIFIAVSLLTEADTDPLLQSQSSEVRAD